MSIVRYFLIVILSVIVGFFGLRFYDNYSESTEINTFLEEAYIVSTLHNESSKEYSKLIDFDEINRDNFETTFIETVQAGAVTPTFSMNS